MMNGALTVGTRDGATIEMAEAAGEEHFFLFGLTAEQVQNSRGWYNTHWHDEHEPETHRALELIRSGVFDRGDPGVLRPICDVLLEHGDHYMHLADLSAYVKVQEQAIQLYHQPDAWARRAIINVGHSGGFSSDRTILEYARGIWGARPCSVDQS
jgi:starch phosphorylase